MGMCGVRRGVYDGMVREGKGFRVELETRFNLQ